MSFSEHLKSKMSGKNSHLTNSAIIWGTFAWFIGYIYQFTILDQVGLDPSYIIFPLVSGFLGAIFFLFWSSKQNLQINYMLSGFIIFFSLIFLNFNNDSTSAIIALSLASFALGNSFLFYLLLPDVFNSPEFNGRLIFIPYIPTIIFVLIALIFVELKNQIALTLIFGVWFFIYLGSFLLGRNESTLPSRILSIKSYLDRSVFPLSALIFSFFAGYFFLNAYYAVILLLKNSQAINNVFAYPTSLYVFNFIFFTTALIVSLPCGILYDKIGRRKSILIGLYLEALTFFLILFLPTFVPNIDQTFLYLLIFPILLASGFALAIFGSFFVYTIELAPNKDQLVTHSGFVILFFSSGEIVGLILDEILRPFIILGQTLLLSVLMIFACFTATTIVFQLKEPLTPREELEWKQKTEHIIVILKSGIPIYSQSLQDKILKTDAVLAGGALIGISTMVKEITQAKNLKVLKQENYCIMLEEGQHSIIAVMIQEELKIVRQKMIDLLTDFEDFFEDLLAESMVNVNSFLPTKKLIEKYFD